ncbi:hypothetical protein [Desulfonatronospira sp.]|uniref:hypothetical protein n=1 Tax=Desulfonatronospira sp. TaxID=1962951 RepID=UPI0025BB2DAC|nr:hypothetical protein [Desulfonatronospira sp.]
MIVGKSDILCRWPKFLSSLTILFFAVFLIPGITFAQNEYPPLKSVSEKFSWPEPNTGVHRVIFPYTLLEPPSVDGSKFSIYVPAGTRLVYLSIGASREATLTVRSQIPEIPDRTVNVDYGGLHKYQVIDNVHIDTADWIGGRWVFFEYSNGARPIYYHSAYKYVDTNHPSYTPPSEDDPVPPESSPPVNDTPPADDSPPENGTQPENGSSPDNGSGYVPPDNPFDRIGDRQPPFGGGEQPPEHTPVVLEAAGPEPQKISAGELSPEDYLMPKVHLNDNLMPKGADSGISGHGYAMLKINEVMFILIEDSLGQPILMPASEVGFRPYCLNQHVDLSENIWECTAFGILQDFLSSNGLGPSSLADMYSDGHDIIFYVGFAPKGNIDNIQIAAFQIVP